MSKILFDILIACFRLLKSWALDLCRKMKPVTKHFSTYYNKREPNYDAKIIYFSD